MTQSDDPGEPSSGLPFDRSMAQRTDDPRDASSGLPYDRSVAQPGGPALQRPIPPPMAPLPPGPRPMPPVQAPSATSVWVRRAAMAVVALAVLYALSSWFSSGLSVERVGPRPAAGGKVLILLHGAGAPGDDLVGLAEECSARSPDVTLLVPEGPHRAFGGRVWVPRFSAPSREDYVVRLAKELETTNALVWDVIASARKDGVACGDIYVGGFSQGGRMAAEVALRAPPDCTLGGAIIMSGGGMDEINLPTAGGAPMRILVAHGRQDGVVGFGRGEATARHFADAGHDVRMLAFDGSHTIADVVRKAIPTFLRGEEVGTPVTP